MPESRKNRKPLPKNNVPLDVEAFLAELERKNKLEGIVNAYAKDGKKGLRKEIERLYPGSTTASTSQDS